jgi:hypothetical protein
MLRFKGGNGIRDRGFHVRLWRHMHPRIPCTIGAKEPGFPAALVSSGSTPKVSLMRFSHVILVSPGEFTILESCSATAGPAIDINSCPQHHFGKPTPSYLLRQLPQRSTSGQVLQSAGPERPRVAKKCRGSSLDNVSWVGTFRTR